MERTKRQGRSLKTGRRYAGRTELSGTGQARQWLPGLAVSLGVLIVVLLVSVILLGQRLYAQQKELAGLRQEEQELQEAASVAEEIRKELQTRVERLLQDNATLQERLMEAEREAEEAGQALKEKLAAEAEARKSAASPYSSLYPELYAQPAALESRIADNTVYLTFDDGPSARTAEILDILKENDIKATFFVTGQTGELAQEMMRRIVDEGHTIAIHTYSHEYRTIYASVSAYLEDFSRIYSWVYEVTGVYPQIFRFPGGTINSYNRKLYKDLVAEMDRRGFVHYDWNAMSGDAEQGEHTAEELTENALAKVGANRVILLMHDSVDKTGTVACLPSVIDGYRDAGYTFAPLSPEVKAITFD